MENEQIINSESDNVIRRCSPAEIEIALWYYCRPTPHPSIPDNETYHCIVQFFINYGIFAQINKSPWYTVTEKGSVWINAVCSVPFPECVWTIPPQGGKK